MPHANAPLTETGTAASGPVCRRRRVAATAGRGTVPGLGHHRETLGRPLPRPTARPAWSTGPHARTAVRAGPRPAPNDGSSRSGSRAGGDQPGSRYLLGPDALHRAPGPVPLPPRPPRSPGPGHRPAGIRRYEHAAPGDLVHVDIKKLGNIPDGGGRRVHGRAAGTATAPPTATRTGHARSATAPTSATATSTTPSTTTPAWPTPKSCTDETQRDRRRVLGPRPGLVHRPRHHRRHAS